MASTAARPRDPAKRSEGMSNRDKLVALQKMFPIKNGMRLRAKGEPSNRNVRAATLWLYIESGKEYEIHETVLGKRDAKSSVWWSRYIANKVLKGSGKNSDSPLHRMGVVEGAIIPGIYNKTRKHWTVRAVIGYNLHDNIRAIYTSLHSNRNKTKR